MTANDGDIRPFIRFIAECAERTLDAYLWSTKENTLVPFSSDDNENIIAVQDHLDYHDKIVLGGAVGNITVEPWQLKQQQQQLQHQHQGFWLNDF